MVSADVGDPFKLIIEIEESTKNRNEEVETDKRIINNNANSINCRRNSTTIDPTLVERLHYRANKERIILGDNMHSY